MRKADYSVLSSPIEISVRKRGATPEAVWLDRQGARQKGLLRCDAIYRMIDDRPRFSLLDVGCGPGLAIGYLQDRFGSRMHKYCGIDISGPLTAVASERWPSYEFLQRDIIANAIVSAEFCESE